MKDATKWLTETRRTAEDLNTRWSTLEEFSSILRALLCRPDSPVGRLLLRFESPAPFERIDVDVACDETFASEEATGTWITELADNRPSTCRVSWWKRVNINFPQPKLQQVIEQIVTGFWKPDVRTETAGIADLKRVAQVAELADATLAARPSEAPAAALCCDLDNFKSVNDAHGKPEGNRVIRAFGAMLERCSGNSAIVFHNGGDEFVVLMPTSGAFQALLLANSIASKMRDWVKSQEALDVTASIGIAVTAPYAVEEFKALVGRAEQTLDRELKAKGRELHDLRGSARVDGGEEEGARSECPTEDMLALAKAVVQSGALADEAFSNPWLNALSAMVYRTVLALGGNWREALPTTVAEYLDWAKPTEDGVAVHPRNFGYAGGSLTKPLMSNIECAFAVAHGISRVSAGYTPPSGVFSIRYNKEATAAALVISDESIWSSDATASLSEELVIGTPQTLERDAAARHEMPANAARAVLVKIGHAGLSLPAILFSRVIIVDDRPTLGGGLPDFWELTIGRLIAHVIDHPRATAVFVLGDHANGAKTVDKLRRVAEWKGQTDELAVRLPARGADIAHVSDHLRDHVYFPQSEGELIQALSHLLTTPAPLPADRPHAASRQRPLSLKMDVSSSSATIGDGCRVGTLADAYPTVLEILRTTDTEIIRDQAGQELRELLDFKVVLTKPLRERVPAFFLGEQEELDAYFKRGFVDEQGLFRAPLEKHRQLETVLTHVCGVLRQPQQAVATRRAVLIVPHECDKGGECKPLGLTSIRIIPRFDGQHAILHYSFTWRTVEALIGFPYSVYGSICYAESLTERLKAAVATDADVEISMGQLSYIAHSLHLFVDEYGQSIARRIVHEASY